MNSTPSALVVALSIAVVALWLLVVRDTWRAWQPSRLLLAGRYGEARASAERLARSWMRLFPSVRLSAGYTIGCALHLEGDLEGSLAAMERLRRARLGPGLRRAVCSIDAASLVLLGRDFAHADALLQEAARSHRPPEDLLLAAHVKHALGDARAADALFVAAGSERIGRGDGERQRRAMFHALRGLYLVKVGRGAEAQRDLEIAAKNSIVNVYVERARAMLASAASETDGPSSLAPQVLAKDVGTE